MPAVIAFFPWLTSPEVVKVGPIRLIPYYRRKAPGNQTNVTQIDIDGVLKAYSRKPKSVSKEATILEVGKWRTGMETTPAVVSQLFKARELVAFSALAERRLFTHFDYCNFDTYVLVVQRFKPGDTGTFAFVTRRRDGGTHQLWGADEFAFHLPNHVEARARLRIDKGLLATLARLPKSLSRILEAIREFNAANTDSNDVPEHVEMVMMKSAFEWLLGINERADVFQKALMTCLRDFAPMEGRAGPLARRWRNRWNNVRPIEAWAMDFCVVRAPAAHGLKRNVGRASVWSATEHLAFAALLFPLLVKKILRDEDLMKMDDFDIQRLRRIDAYLMHNPFVRKPHPHRYPWSEVDSSALYEARASRIYDIAKRALPAAT